MRLNLENLDQSIWVDWKDGVSIKIRPLPVSKTRELQEKAAKKKIDFEGGRKVIKKEIDNEAFNDLLQEHLVEDWRGINDQNDKPIPCTPENIKAVLDYFHELRLFIVMTGQELEDLRQGQQEEAEKNS